MHLNIQSADLVLCNSKFSKQRIEKAYPGIQAHTSYIGIDTHAFSPTPNQNFKHQIISVGALDPSKNHGFAIEVAAEKPAGLNLKVVIVTDRSHGNTADQLRELAENHKVELEILTRVPTEKLAQCYRDSLATVYSPIEEPFGIVSLESQSCGTPILGANEGGLKETIVDNISGFLLPRNPKSFSQKLAEWIEKPNTRAELSKSAREHALQHWQRKNLIMETCTAITQQANANI
jgi:glycosyltransferase involved in cell wall biosynthesis